LPLIGRTSSGEEKLFFSSRMRFSFPRSTGAVLPRAIGRDPNDRQMRAGMSAPASPIAALCETGRAASKMAVPLRMQGWTVGAAIGHVLLLHA
jgi:hypothetical protein